MADCQIIEIERSDWQAYRDIRLRSLLHSPESFGSAYAAVVARSDAQWMSLFEPSNARVSRPLFAVLDQQIAGLVWGEIEPDSPVVGHIYQMWVDPALRGQGIGKALLLSLIDWFGRSRVAAVELAVASGNSAARALYESLGFAAVGDPEPLRSGHELFAQSMVLRLESFAVQHEDT
jgi:ribosomal protein S18 acetylase RimI-like enzyme